MPETNANRFNPKRWTALTWLAVLLWAWQPIALNYPPSVSYTVDSVTGEFTDPTHYTKLSEIPFPVGWPLHYVRPSYLSASPAPVTPVGAPPPPPAPSSVHPFALVANIVLAVIALSALVYFLQKTTYRYSLLFLFGVVVAVPAYFGLGRLVAILGGYSAVQWYSIAVYFAPIPAAVAARYSIFPLLNGSRFRSMRNRCRGSHGEYGSADDAITAASTLEMCGDWTASIELYQLAAERWPEHSEYVQHCVDRVTEKQSLAQT